MGPLGRFSSTPLLRRAIGPRRPSRWLVAALALTLAGGLSFALGPAAGASGQHGATTPPVATSGTPSGTTVPVQDTAYWLDASTGAVYSFGGAPDYGSMAGHPLNKPIVGMAAMPTGKGYWEVASDGGIFTFGDAKFYGSEGAAKLVAPIVGMAAAPTGHGYWLVAADGGIFTFGTARFYGSEGGVDLVAPVVGMAPTRTGHGYWLVAADGGIFTFGNATFEGSMGGHVLAQPVTSMATMPTGTGYWLVATDGGVFTFGGATGRFYGSLGNQHITQPVVGIASLYNGAGYWLAGGGGSVTAFGSAVYWGSTPDHISGRVVGIATGLGDGDPGPPSFQPGSYGYDVSQYQCSGFPPAPHQIGVVEVAGWSYGAVNPCLAREVTWAAGGLNLYTFLSYGTSTTAAPGCAGNVTAPTTPACNYGYGAAVSSYEDAKAAVGTRVDVPWWLDVEQIGFSSSPSTAASRSVVVGAYDALRYTEDINTVGFYFSVAHWNDLVGAYNPSAPLFPAWWTGPTPAYKCTDARTEALSLKDTLPSGPIQLLQYTDSVNKQPFDGDYAC
jgi:ribosomal protein L24E